MIETPTFLIHVDVFQDQSVSGRYREAHRSQGRRAALPFCLFASSLSGRQFPNEDWERLCPNPPQSFLKKSLHTTLFDP